MLYMMIALDALNIKNRPQRWTNEENDLENRRIREDIDNVGISFGSYHDFFLKMGMKCSLLTWLTS